MSLFTLIGRVGDGLLLCGTQHDNYEQASLKRQCKQILKSLNNPRHFKVSISADSHYIHYYIDNDICYLTLSEASYPTELAFCYLEDIARTFQYQYGNQVFQYNSSYAAIGFGS